MGPEDRDTCWVEWSLLAVHVITFPLSSLVGVKLNVLLNVKRLPDVVTRRVGEPETGITPLDHTRSQSLGYPRLARHVSWTRSPSVMDSLPLNIGVSGGPANDITAKD